MDERRRGRAAGPAQLALGIAWRRGVRFEHLVAGGNAEAIRSVRRVAEQGGVSCLHLWGRTGTGKTHLLHAACEAAAAAGRRVAYVPLAERAREPPETVAGFDAFDLVCLDDVQHIAARRGWEEGVFGLYQRLRAKGSGLLVAAPCSPAGLGLTLPDLASRFAADLVIRLRPLGDGERREVLRLHARQRGLELTPEVGDFILRRHRRDLHALLGLLERLDAAALAAQRALTLPFVREVMAREGSKTLHVPLRGKPGSAQG